MDATYFLWLLLMMVPILMQLISHECIGCILNEHQLFLSFIFYMIGLKVYQILLRMLNMNKNSVVVMFQTGNVDGFVTMSQKTFWY